MDRIKDQVFHNAVYKRLQRINKLYAEANIDELFNFAKNYSRFELKFSKINTDNIVFFQDLINIFFKKGDFKLNVLVIDREDKYYVHKGLVGMYKSIISLYSKHCVVDDFIFIPDIFDTRFDWSSINFTDHMLQIIPEISDNSLPLQVIDIFTGIIGLGLRLKYLDKKYLTNSDKKRIPMVKTLEKLMNREIDKNFTITSPHYISIWTIDYSKKK